MKADASVNLSAPKKKKSSFLYVIFAVLCAVFLWFYVAGVDTEMSDKTFTVTIALKNEDAMLNQYGFAVLSGKNLSADVTVSGKRSQITQLRQSDITAYVDLSSVSEAGEHKLTVQTDLPDGMTATSCYPQTVTIYADQSGTRSLPVEVQIVKMTKNDDLELSDPDISAPIVNVTGPDKLLNSISRAVVSLDLGEVTKSFETMGSVVFYDADNEPIESSYLRSDTKEVTVAYSVFKKKSVNLKIGFVHGYLDESRVKSTIEPQTVVIKGDPDRVDNLSEITIYKLDETSLTSTGTLTTISVDNLPLPDGVTLDSADGANQVTISVKPLDSHKTFTVSLSNVTVKAPDSMKYSFNKEVIEVTVRGDSVDLAKIRTDNIHLSLDLSGYTNPGIKTGVQLTVDQQALNEKNCYAVGEYTLNVTLTGI